MEIEKTKPISAYMDLKTSGLCLPSRSSLASGDSSSPESGGEAGVLFSGEDGDGVARFS